MGRGWGRELVERVQNVSIRIREEVSVEVERHADRRVAHLRLQVLRMRAGRDHQSGVGVPQVVEAEPDELRATDRRREDAVTEVVVVQNRAFGRREDETELVRLARKQLSAEDKECRSREVDAESRRSEVRRPTRAMRSTRLLDPRTGPLGSSS
jgi:hypothetical protein